MPSDTLELLDEIVKGAEAATGKGAGQPLRAEEWNTLAEAIARLARLAASRERGEAETLAKNYARADHQHLGEVGLAWLDAPTRALVEARGGAGDIAARLDALTRDTRALRTDLQALTGQVEHLRDDLSGATTEDRVRDGTIRRLSERLDGIVDLDRRVTTMDGRITGLDANVREAIAFRDTLRDASGAPLDLAQLSSRVDGLSTNLERLRLANGEVVRMRDFENRIASLEEGGVTSDDLDTRIGTRLGDLVAAPDSVLVNRAGAAAVATLDPRLRTIEGGLEAASRDIVAVQGGRAADGARMDALDTRLAAETVRGDRSAATLDTLAALPVRVTAVEAAAGAANQRLSAVDALAADLGRVRDQATVAAALAPRVTALETTDRDQDRRIGAAETIAGTVPDLRVRVEQVEASATRADALSGRISNLEGQVVGIGSRVTVAESRLGTLDTLTSRVATVERNTTELTSWRRGVDDRLGSLPDRTAILDLTSRVSAVERRSTDQQLRIDQIGRTTVSPVVTPSPFVRPIG
jgi:hypothetical protein